MTQLDDQTAATLHARLLSTTTPPMRLDEDRTLTAGRRRLRARRWGSAVSATAAVALVAGGALAVVPGLSATLSSTTGQQAATAPDGATEPEGGRELVFPTYAEAPAPAAPDVPAPVQLADGIQAAVGPYRTDGSTVDVGTLGGARVWVERAVDTYSVTARVEHDGSLSIPATGALDGRSGQMETATAHGAGRIYSGVVPTDGYRAVLHYTSGPGDPSTGTFVATSSGDVVLPTFALPAPTDGPATGQQLYLFSIDAELRQGPPPVDTPDAAASAIDPSAGASWTSTWHVFVIDPEGAVLGCQGFDDAGCAQKLGTTVAALDAARATL